MWVRKGEGCEGYAEYAIRDAFEGGVEEPAF
jgi:hypothetical protein